MIQLLSVNFMFMPLHIYPYRFCYALNVHNMLFFINTVVVRRCVSRFPSAIVLLAVFFLVKFKFQTVLFFPMHHVMKIADVQVFFVSAPQNNHQI